MNKEKPKKCDKDLYIGVFLAGLAKCGTSTLADHLMQHPQITSVRKDPVAWKQRRLWPSGKKTYDDKKVPNIMLTRVEGVQINWEKSWLSLSMLDKRIKRPLSRYTVLPQTPQTRPDDWQTIAADCSPLYFSVPGCAQAIKALYPDARIIITLRYPIDWFYSWHCMMLRHQIQRPYQISEPINPYEPPTFAESFSRNRGRGIFRRSLSERLAEWIDTFDRDQIKVIILEEWSHKPEQTARECYRFIGCLLYTSPSPRDRQKSRMPSSA